MLRRVFALVTAFAVALVLPIADAHAYLAEPPARNVLNNYEYCPQCLNGPEFCGDRHGEHTNEVQGPVVGTYAPGGTLRARIVITANHLGRWYLRLCRGHSCKKLRTSKGSKYVYVRDSDSESQATFIIPDSVPCSTRCVLKFAYETGNSCTPPGTPAKFANPGLSICGSASAPAQEIFTNCADISVQ